MSIYDAAKYPRGVPNPYGPRVHAWNDYPGAYGTRYHGGVWTRPEQSFTTLVQPVSGIGALGLAPVPWPCWEATGFADCHTTCQSRAAGDCQTPVSGGSPYWVDAGYGSLQACADELGRACDFQQCIPNYCPEHAPTAREGSTTVEAATSTKRAALIGLGLGAVMIAYALHLNRRR